MQSYNVVDNFLDKREFDKIKQSIMYGGIPWHYSSNVSGKNEDDDMYFASILYDHMSGIKSEFLNVVLPVIAKIQPTILIRVKANLYTNTGTQRHHSSHKDYTFPHKGAIFYINENNGPTVIDGVTEVLKIEFYSLILAAHIIA